MGHRAKPSFRAPFPASLIIYASYLSSLRLAVHPVSTPSPPCRCLPSPQPGVLLTRLAGDQKEVFDDTLRRGGAAGPAVRRAQRRNDCLKQSDNRLATNEDEISTR
eukprot:6195413-Pleurochrysis_carterae.AAC.4